MISTKRCAYLTMQDTAGFFMHDHLTYVPLEELGWTVAEIPWNDPEVDWNQFDAVVIRSPWDYQKTPSEFLQVLATIDDSRARLLNPLQICRWNMNKTYLRELADRGIPTIPTVWRDHLDRHELSTLFAELHTERMVVKPTVGANADDTFVLDASNPASWRAALQTFEQKPLLAQPFVDSILTEGEYSLFYFDGQFSHAIQKRPKAQDFRVQEEHGGTIRGVVLDQEFHRAGQAVIDAIGQSLLYARVDLVRWKENLVLMELELIEPSLYFSYDDGSAVRFANALDRLVR